MNEMGRVNGNLNLSRSLGDLKYKQIVNAPPQDQMITAFPDVTATQMTPQDEFMILACDGVWDILSNQDACDFVRERIQGGNCFLLYYFYYIYTLICILNNIITINSQYYPYSQV